MPQLTAAPSPCPEQALPALGKGQSGNPAGRPPRFHPPAAVADYLIARKAIPVAKQVLTMALGGDKEMLKLWYQHQMAVCRRALPDWPGLPLVADPAGLREAVTRSAEKGAMSPGQADALLRLVNTVMGTCFSGPRCEAIESDKPDATVYL